MTFARTPLFVANWKMNKRVAECAEFADAFGSLLQEIPMKLGETYEAAIAPPFTHLPALGKALAGSGIDLGAQNCGAAKSGAYTGEISPSVLRELGCRWAIVGHSERRQLYKEDDALVLARLRAAIEEDLGVILCVGETLPDRRADRTWRVVESQLSGLAQKPLRPDAWKRVVIAYEPVWAIGTGENATPTQAQEVHAQIRAWVHAKVGAAQAGDLRIVYGGSVKPDNAAALLAERDIDGFLVGGASLEAVTFANLVRNGLKSAVN